MSKQELRECTNCHKAKPYSEFGRDTRRLIPYKTVCKVCQKVQATARKANASKEGVHTNE